MHRSEHRHLRRFVLGVFAVAMGATALALALGGREATARVATGTAAASPAPAAARGLSLAERVGQLVVATYAGTQPPASLLGAVRAGHVGAVFLAGTNTADSVAVTRAATGRLQAAARAGRQPGLLIMTDQEGGEVKRLPGPPDMAAADMSSPEVAGAQGAATARLLRRAGVNVDLAPVADVTRIDGFLTQEQRTFGASPARVAAAACAFAAGLARGGVAYTLKHFPGLGDALDSTDDVPVAVDESASDLQADGAAYRDCGHGPLALVMVSSASYANVSGRLPAVLSPLTYHTLFPRDHIDAVSLSDTLEGGAIRPWPAPAEHAIAAGLDMVLYPGAESAGLGAWANLLGDAERGRLSSGRVTAAAAAVLSLKARLGLTGR